MCQSCETVPMPGAPSRRLKLWEVAANWHCTIIGTCLSMAEIRSVATKFGVRPATGQGTSDYEIHSAMVQLAAREKVIGKALTKMLDRKHAAALKRFAGATCEDELPRLWSQSLERGEVGGACWAIMSHPAATEKIRGIIFGELHMLSHQAGAGARADLRRGFVLEREKAELEHRLSALQERLREELRDRDRRITELTQRLDLEMAETRRLSHAENAAENLSSLQSLCRELQSQLDQQIRSNQDAEDRWRAADSAHTALALRLEQTLRDHATLQNEHQLCEARLAARLGDSVASCGHDCGRLDLCGRCVLFVGGRDQQIPHFRRLVEECNGTLVHHDGGLEDGVNKLHGLMGRADAVLFPIDCVSHMAQDEVKKLCRRWDKPLLPIRTSGLGALMQALHSLSHGTPDQAGHA